MEAKKFVQMKELETITGLKRTKLRSLAAELKASHKIGDHKRSACLYDLKKILDYIEAC